MHCTQVALTGYQPLRPASLRSRAKPFVKVQQARFSQHSSRLIVRAGLIDSLAAAPIPAIGAAAATVLAVGGYAIWAAMNVNKDDSQSDTEVAQSEPEIPREDAVLVVGAGGRMGRQLTAAVSYDTLSIASLCHYQMFVSLLHCSCLNKVALWLLLLGMLTGLAKFSRTWS